MLTQVEYLGHTVFQHEACGTQEDSSMGVASTSGTETTPILFSANQTIQSTYRKNEKEKRRQCEKRIIKIEHGSFTLLVMSATGGLGPFSWNLLQENAPHDQPKALIILL